jgi:hypothetical protein
VQGIPSASASTAPAAPEPTEIVHRPQPGTLQAGRYEAPSWAFYLAASGVVLIALIYFVVRLAAGKHKRA